MFLDISEGNPGVLIPLLSSPNTNLPYVQQMDEYLQVKEVVPFLEYENYPLIPFEYSHTITVGDKGLIAFRSYDGNIVCGNVSEILAYIAKHQEAIANIPILQSQLNRIESAELNPSYDIWRAVADTVFYEKDQIKFWVDSELHLFQKQKKIWSEIDPLEPDEPKASESGIYGSISNYSDEYLVRWLSNRSNFGKSDWTKIWHFVNERTPFDDRVPEVALNWIFQRGGEEQENSGIKSIVFALLERWITFGYEPRELGDFLCDRLAAEPFLIFDFLRPQRLFSVLFKFLAKRGEIDEVLKIISFCASELPREPYIVDALSAALEAMVEQTKRVEDNWKPATRNRDFEEKQISNAVELLSSLRINRL